MFKECANIMNTSLGEKINREAILAIVRNTQGAAFNLLQPGRTLLKVDIVLYGHVIQAYNILHSFTICSMAI